MLTIEGTYKDGKVELAERPAQVIQSRVLVTFLESNGLELQPRGIDETHAAELRARLKAFAEDCFGIEERVARARWKITSIH